MNALALPTPEAARAHPALWAIYASEGAWQPYAWLRWLCEQVQAFLDGPDRFLAVSVPPGHGKSEFLSKFFPTWFLGTNPGARVIQASYAASLTLEWSKVSKELLALHGNEVFGVEVHPKAKSEAWDVFRWSPKAQRSIRSGYLRAVGRGGPVTGKRAELLIVDDILKDDEEAQSPVIREKAWRWFTKVALTRLTKSGKALVVMTRWHWEDLVGRLEDRQRRGLDKDGWKIIRLPAMAEENDPMGRAVGEALCPELFPIEELRRIKARDGHTWNALYQGRPTAEGGAIYKREHFRYAKVSGDSIEVKGKQVPMSDLVLFGVADLAVSEKETADFSAFGAFGADLIRGNLFWFGLKRDRMDGPTVLRTLKDMGRKMGMWVEKTAYHLHMIQLAVSQGVPIRMLEPDKDKVARAHPAAALFEAGRFYFAEGEEWLADAEAELLRFPAGKDDVADVCAYAVRVFNDMLQTGPQMEVDELGGDGWWSGSRNPGGGW